MMGLRSGVLVAGLSGLLLTHAGSVTAAEGAGGTLPESLFEFALPYSPYLFDLALYAGRSVAEITYDERRYDDVTGSLVVSGLRIRRDDFSADIGQMRLSADQVIYEAVAVDTRALSLEPSVRAVLQRLDRELLIGDIVMTGRSDVAAADIDWQVSVAVDGVGTLDVSGDLRGFHVLLPLDDLDGGGMGDTPVLAGRLQSAEVSFTDAGLVEALYAVFGGMQGMTADQARGTASMLAGIGVATMFSDLPGGPDPRLQELSQEWSASIQAFLARPDRVTVRLEPAEAFDLRRLITDTPIRAADILALSPQVVTGPAPQFVLRDPDSLALAPDADLDEVLPAARALIDGHGVPQDIAQGVALLLPAVASDNRDAIALLARALALNPRVVIPQDGLRDAYVALLLARADGISMDGDSLVAVQGRLSPEEVAAAEDDAQLRWRRTPAGKARHAVEVAAFGQRDWATIRRLAFGYYEGLETPRNGMRAYGWASIAAAGGDRIAAGLRDDLVAAVNAGRFVLPMERAKTATAELWKLLIAEAPDAERRPEADPDKTKPAQNATPTDGNAAGSPVSGTPDADQVPNGATPPAD